MRLFLSLVVALALAGCATREIGTVRPAPVAISQAGNFPTDAAACATERNNVWVTIDGTANTPVGRTAATRLHEMVEAYSYTQSNHSTAIWYAEGVGSADHDIVGKAFGVGVNEDIKKAYAFLTRVWRPCDRLFFNGFSRGAYTVRALGGLLYMAGIPDLSREPEEKRTQIVDALFDAYKTRKAYPGEDGLARRRAERIDAVYRRFGLDRENRSRAGGFRERDTLVAIEAMTIWDSVQAIGLPDGSEDPTEGPAYFLITACNAKAIFQPLALDDNRAYSFTPVLAGGDQATYACTRDGGRQNVSRTIEEVWFSGAHADVSGTYELSTMLDGELSSVSLNWVLDSLRGPACPGCGAALALPEGLRIPEDRLSAIHDAKRTSPAYRTLYRQSRKPLVYWHHVYGSSMPVAVHASVFDRLERLFALDGATPGCNGGAATGKPVLCARQIASHGLIPELLKGNCLETTGWGYRLTANQACVAVIGTRSAERPTDLPACEGMNGDAVLRGMIYAGRIENANRRVVATDYYDIPYPRCLNGPAMSGPWQGSRPSR